MPDNFAAIINAEAGTISRYGPDKFETLLKDRLGSRLGSVRIAQARNFTQAVRQALEERPEALLVVGGDGSARTAAELIRRAKAPAAFLPGGTMNILPRRLGAASGLEAVVERIAEGQLQPVALDLGLIGGQPFFVAAGFGIAPHLARLRERVRRAHGVVATIGRAYDIVRLAPRLLERRTRFATAERGRSSAVALLVSVGDADALAPFQTPKRVLAAFECVSLQAGSPWDVASLTVKATLGRDWREDPRIEAFETRRLTVSSGRRTRLTLDGEPIIVRGPLRVQFVPGGLEALGFAPGEAAADPMAGTNPPPA